MPAQELNMTCSSLDDRDPCTWDQPCKHDGIAMKINSVRESHSARKAVHGAAPLGGDFCTTLLDVLPTTTPTWLWQTSSSFPGKELMAPVRSWALA